MPHVTLCAVFRTTPFLFADEKVLKYSLTTLFSPERVSLPFLFDVSFSFRETRTFVLSLLLQHSSLEEYSLDSITMSYLTRICVSLRQTSFLLVVDLL